MKTTAIIVCVFAALGCAVMAGLTEAQRQQLLDGHNQARNKVAEDFPDHPPIGPLNQVSWDKDVEAIAQAYADTCPDDHSHTAGLGENLAWNTGYSDPIQTAIDGWYGEVKDYHYEATGEPTSGVVGHYTQMVWNKTTKIGCGWKGDCSGRFRNVIVCNYKPQGNYVGQHPWVEGTPVPVPSSDPSSSSPVTPSSSHAAPSSSSPVTPSSSHVAPSSSHVAPSSSHVAPSSSHVTPSSSHASSAPSKPSSTSTPSASASASFVKPAISAVAIALLCLVALL